MLFNQDQGRGLLLRHVWPESQAVRLRCGSVSDTVGGHPQSLAMLEAHDSLPVDAGFPFSHPPTALVLYSASTENRSVMYFHYWVTSFAYERKNRLLCWMKIIQLTSKWQSQESNSHLVPKLKILSCATLHDKGKRWLRGQMWDWSRLSSEDTVLQITNTAWSHWGFLSTLLFAEDSEAQGVLSSFREADRQIIH